MQCAAGTRRTARSPPTSCFKLSPPPQWALLLQRPCAPELCRSSTGGAERARCADPTFTLLPRMETLRWRVSNWQSGYKVEPWTVDFNSKVSFSCTADFFFLNTAHEHRITPQVSLLQFVRHWNPFYSLNPRKHTHLVTLSRSNRPSSISLSALRARELFLVARVALHSSPGARVSISGQDQPAGRAWRGALSQETHRGECSPRGDARKQDQFLSLSKLQNAFVPNV